jgi:hypothetical protein
MTSKVIIDIITEFKGLQNVKKAESAFDSLTRSLKGFAAAYTVERVVTSSINAFKEQQAVLAGYDNSLKNLGVSYQDIAPIIDQTTQKFIDLGFQDNQTIEALTKLTTALGNPAKALEVLSTTADLARYKQMSLAETGTLVAKAIAGNSRAFADLGLKIDKNLDPINAFNKLMTQAKEKAGGAAQAYAKTLGGSLDIASAKAENASEALGKALAPSLQKLASAAVKYLIPAFTLLANNITPILALTGVLGGLALAMKAVGLASAIMAGELAINPLFARATAATVGGFALFKVIKGIPSFLKSLTSGFLGLGGAPVGGGDSPKSKAVDKVTAAEKLLANLEKQWNADSLKAAKATAAADAAKIKAEKDKLALEKARQVLQSAGKVVDVQQAQIVAALMSSTDPEVIKRLQLQQALLNDNADLAGKLAQQILAVQAANIEIQNSDPFAGMTQGAKDALAAVKALQTELNTRGAQPAQTPAWANLATDASAALADSMLGSDLGAALDQALKDTTAITGVTYINNTYQGTVVADQQLSNMLANNSASGIASNVSRLNYNFSQ